jgi:hypothetical protein
MKLEKKTKNKLEKKVYISHCKEVLISTVFLSNLMSLAEGYRNSFRRGGFWSARSFFLVRRIFKKINLASSAGKVLGPQVCVCVVGCSSDHMVYLPQGSFLHEVLCRTVVLGLPGLCR